MPLEQIVACVEKNHGKVEYKAAPEALEYRETLLMEKRGQDPAYDPSHDEELEEEQPASRATEAAEA